MSTGTSLKRSPSAFSRVELIPAWLLMGYCALCSITIPFINAIWLGELPLLAVIQVPKLAVATWFRRGIVMDAIRLLDCSQGSFSPDYLMARPWALALAYLLPVGIVLAISWPRNQRSPTYRWLALAVVAAAMVDYAMTLVFGHQRFLTIY